MKRWLQIWILAAVPAVAWGQASTGLPAPSTNGISGVPIPTLATGYLYYNSGTNSFVFQSPSGSGSVNNCASAYAVAYYAGSGTTVSCSTAFTGLAYFSTSSAPVAATGAQIVSAIGSAAVANATSATSFTGSLSGDVTGTQSATTVGKINGGAVPASASVLSSNSSSQLTAATNITTTASSTLGGSANLFNNASAATNVVEIQAGTSAAQTEELQWQNYSGTAEWDNSVDSSYTYHIQDAAHSSLDRITIYQGGGNTNINAGSGAYEVCLNCAANSGTAGFVVQNGASSPSTVLTVTGSGNTTATGFVSGKFFMGNSTMTLATGAAAGSSPTIACATSHVCDGVSGTVTLTTGTSPTTGTLATLSFPNTHSNYANCIVTTESAAAVITTNTWTESTTAITITANTALTASTAYAVKYWCGGN
jgi:trimeric autotransporter adhesin